MTRRFRTSPFRQSLAFVFAVSLSTAVVADVIYCSISATIESRRRIIVADEVAAMLSSDRERIVDDLNRGLKNGLLLYSVAGIFDGNHVDLGGNLRALPQGLVVDGKVHKIEIPADLIRDETLSDPSIHALVAATRRADGSIVVFGRTLTEVPLLRRRLYEFGLYGLVGLLTASFAYGVWANSRQWARLRAIQLGFSRIMGGALDERLPSDGKRDDLDRFVHDVNRMLDMVSDLLVEVKSVGDNIAHDLRTPLAIIRARLERAVVNGTDVASLKATMAASILELDRANKTIGALLRLAEIENRQRRAGFQECDMARICREAVEFYRPLAELKSISLTLDAPHALTIFGDADLLTEAINNILDNSIKFSDIDGFVAVSLVSEPEIRLSISDDGRGISEDHLDKLGHRFFRSDPSRGEPGSGLGLSLVHAIAKLHDFRVEIESRPSHGTTVQLVRSLPY